MRRKKKASDSFTVMTQLIMPNDTNHLGNLMGGILLRWMDVAGALSAMRHCNAPVVTAAVDNVSFEQPIPLGTTVIIEGWVTRSFTTSCEVFMEVYAEKLDGTRIKSNEAFFTYVAVDPDKHKPVVAALVEPETEREKELHDGALRRRELRLMMAGRLKPDQADQLKKLFDF